MSDQDEEKRSDKLKRELNDAPQPPTQGDDIDSHEVRLNLIAQSKHTFSGPLPPPAMLAQYEQVYPGLADRIVKMAEHQQDHRMYVERTVVDSETRNEKRGMYFSFILASSGLFGGVSLVALGLSVTGLIGFFVALGSLVGTTILRRLGENKQLTPGESTSESESPSQGE